MVIKRVSFIAFDIGERTVGYAHYGYLLERSKSAGAFQGSKKQTIVAMGTYLKENALNQAVIGIPFHTETGEITEQGEKIITFSFSLLKYLKANSILSKPLDIFCVDESFTSSEASQKLRIRGKSMRQRIKKSGKIDASAAEEIGRRFLLGEPLYKIYTLEECAAMLDLNSSH